MSSSSHAGGGHESIRRRFADGDTSNSHSLPRRFIVDFVITGRPLLGNVDSVDEDFGRLIRSTNEGCMRSFFTEESRRQLSMSAERDEEEAAGKVRITWLLGRFISKANSSHGRYCDGTCSKSSTSEPAITPWTAFTNASQAESWLMNRGYTSGIASGELCVKVVCGSANKLFRPVAIVLFTVVGLRVGSRFWFGLGVLSLPNSAC